MYTRQKLEGSLNNAKQYYGLWVPGSLTQRYVTTHYLSEVPTAKRVWHLNPWVSSSWLHKAFSIGPHYDDTTQKVTRPFMDVLLIKLITYLCIYVNHGRE